MSDEDLIREAGRQLETNPDEFLKTAEHGGWWQQQIDHDRFEASVSGECKHNTKSVTGTGDGRFKFVCCTCSKVAYNNGENYTPTTDWEAP